MGGEMLFSAEALAVSCTVVSVDTSLSQVSIQCGIQGEQPLTQAGCSVAC